MKKIVVFFFTIAFVLVLHSCKDSLKACFDYAEAGGTVVFTAACSENAENYFWDFGDGTFSKNYNPTHQYNSVGTYTVTLQVTDDYDLDSETMDITITAILDSIPTGGTVDTTEVCKTCTCNISGTVTTSDFCGTSTEADSFCTACNISPDCSCN